MRRAWGLLVATPLAIGAAGCAAFTCVPMSIVVGEREERSGIRDAGRGFRTNEFGQLEEVRGLERVTDYWLRSTDGSWYRVTPEVYRGATPGRTIDVCR